MAAKYEHGEEQYCILHIPSEDKDDDFKKAVQSKLERDDFTFAGVYFPSGFTSFSRATFSEVAYFWGTTVSKVVGFSGATFKEKALFYALKAFSRTVLGFNGAIIEKPERISFQTTYLRPSWFVDVDAQKFDFSDVECKGRERALA